MYRIRQQDWDDPIKVWLTAKLQKHLKHQGLETSRSLEDMMKLLIEDRQQREEITDDCHKREKELEFVEERRILREQMHCGG